MSRIGKHILSLDKAARGETKWLECCWADCERLGVDLHKTRFHDHPKPWPCDHPDAKHLWYVFCTERHRQLFLNAHRSNNNLATGERGRIG